jgi:hypothetical protein
MALEIITDDKRIQYKKDSDAYNGVPINSVRYTATEKSLILRSDYDNSFLVKEDWDNGITVNGVAVTFANYVDVLDALFFLKGGGTSGGGGTTLTPQQLAKINAIQAGGSPDEYLGGDAAYHLIPAMPTIPAPPDLTPYAKKIDVLEKEGTTNFTPTIDTDPTNKKYVDDAITDAIADIPGVNLTGYATETYVDDAIKDVVDNLPSTGTGGAVDSVNTATDEELISVDNTDNENPAIESTHELRDAVTAANTAYQKPATGIPATDLATGVQTSLGKADTAVQPTALNDYTKTSDLPKDLADFTNTGVDPYAKKSQLPDVTPFTKKVADSDQNMNGNGIINTKDGVNDTDVATVGQMKADDALAVKKAGDTMTGALELNGNPTTDNMAANKAYVDKQITDSKTQTLTFKGFISTADPLTLANSDIREGNLWYQPATAEDEPDTAFPWTVKQYDGTAWQTADPYTPNALDLWSNLDKIENNGFYYFGNAWNNLDYSGSAFNSTQFTVSGGVVTIASGAITDTEVATNAAINQSKIKNLVTDLDGKINKSGGEFTGQVTFDNSTEFNSELVLSQINDHAGNSLLEAFISTDTDGNEQYQTILYEGGYRMLECSTSPKELYLNAPEGRPLLHFIDDGAGNVEVDLSSDGDTILRSDKHPDSTAELELREPLGGQTIVYARKQSSGDGEVKLTSTQGNDIIYGSELTNSGGGKITAVQMDGTGVVISSMDGKGNYTTEVNLDGTNIIYAQKGNDDSSNIRLGWPDGSDMIDGNRASDGKKNIDINTSEDDSDTKGYKLIKINGERVVTENVLNAPIQTNSAAYNFLTWLNLQPKIQGNIVRIVMQNIVGSNTNFPIASQNLWYIEAHRVSNGAWDVKAKINGGVEYQSFPNDGTTTVSWIAIATFSDIQSIDNLYLRRAQGTYSNANIAPVSNTAETYSMSANTTGGATANTGLIETKILNAGNLIKQTWNDYGSSRGEYTRTSNDTGATWAPWVPYASSAKIAVAKPAPTGAIVLGDWAVSMTPAGMLCATFAFSVNAAGVASRGALFTLPVGGRPSVGASCTACIMRGGSSIATWIGFATNGDIKNGDIALLNGDTVICSFAV